MTVLEFVADGDTLNAEYNELTSEALVARLREKLQNQGSSSANKDDGDISLVMEIASLKSELDQARTTSSSAPAFQQDLCVERDKRTDLERELLESKEALTQAEQRLVELEESFSSKLASAKLEEASAAEQLRIAEDSSRKMELANSQAEARAKNAETELAGIDAKLQNAEEA